MANKTMTVYESYAVTTKDILENRGLVHSPLTLVANQISFSDASRKKDVTSLYYVFAGSHSIQLEKSVFYEFTDIDGETVIILDEFIESYEVIPSFSRELILHNVTVEQVNLAKRLLQTHGIKCTIGDNL